VAYIARCPLLCKAVVLITFIHINLILFQYTFFTQECQQSGPRYAYVTMVSTPNRGYLKALSVLVYSIRKSGAMFPLIVLLNEATVAKNSTVVKALNYLKVTIKYFHIPDQINFEINPARFPKWQTPLHSWGKICAWREMIGYDKACWLGNDVLVLKNPDYVFNCSPPCTTADLFRGTRCDSVMADFIVFQPSINTFNEFMSLTTGNLSFYNNADQDFLRTHYFTTPWKSQVGYWFDLTTFFDARQWRSPNDTVLWQQVEFSVQNLTMVHFTGHPKPFENANIDGYVYKLWQHVYMDMLEEYPDLKLLF